MDIAEGALDKIFAMYKELLPSLGGYLTHAGQLHKGRLQILLDRIGALELDTLEMRAKVRALHPKTYSMFPFIANPPIALALGVLSIPDAIQNAVHL